MDDDLALHQLQPPFLAIKNAPEKRPFDSSPSDFQKQMRSQKDRHFLPLLETTSSFSEGLQRKEQENISEGC
jgi:hypothetical protein